MNSAKESEVMETTSSGRQVQPPLFVLQQQVQSAAVSLENTLAAIDNLKEPTNESTVSAKQNLRLSWKSYSNAATTLSNALQSKGHIDEGKKLNAIFVQNKTRTKGYLVKLQETLIRKDSKHEGSVLSEFSGLSIRTSSSAKLVAAEALKIAQSNKDAKDLLEELETEEAVARMRFAQKRAKVNREKEFNILRAKLDTFAETNSQEDSLNLSFSDDEAEPKRRIAEWIAAGTSCDKAEFIPATCDSALSNVLPQVSNASEMQRDTFEANHQNIIPTAGRTSTGVSWAEPLEQATQRKPNSYPQLHSGSSSSRYTSIPCPTTNNFNASAGHGNSLSTPLERVKQDEPNRRVFHDQPPQLPQDYQGWSANNLLDPSTRHLAMVELKRPPSSPFNGESSRYTAWMQSLQHRMAPLYLSALDKIDILEAHTIGDPREVVRTFRTAYGYNCEEALTVILQKLEKRFGTDVQIASTLRQQLFTFLEIRGTESDSTVARKLRQLSDLCRLVQAHMNTVSDLHTLNYETGLDHIRKKLPNFLNNKWRMVKNSYKLQFNCHPPFVVFSEFLEENADLLCSDLQFNEIKSTERRVKPTTNTCSSSNFTVLQSSGNVTTTARCVLHQSNTHAMSDCAVFKEMQPKIRKLVVTSHKLCFRCLGNHLATECTAEVVCSDCKSSGHCTLLHISNPPNHKKYNKKELKTHNGKTEVASSSKPKNDQGNSQTLCTAICGSQYGRSCSKTVLVDVVAPNSVSVRVYAIIDEQSNQSFASSHLLNALQLAGPVSDYTISTLSSAERCRQHGRIVTGLRVKGVTESKWYNLPQLYENNNLPDTRHEVATPAVVRALPHLSHLADNFASLDRDAEVSLLLGRDSGNAMATTVLNREAPFAQHTALGWAIVGQTCPYLNRHGKNFTTLRTTIDHDHYKVKLAFPEQQNIFNKHHDDENVDMSVEEKKFVSFVENNVTVNEVGNIQCPLPFRQDDVKLPDNKLAVYRRQCNTLHRIKKNDEMLKQCIAAMGKSIQAGHVEPVPNDELNNKAGNVWFIPVFPVTHPKKGTVRLVFDSAAAYCNISLNSVLLKGPNINNDLRGVLLRFREQAVAFVADIESMYHSFHVHPNHRNFLRYFWYEQNDPSRRIVQYRGNVHIFGNTSSPAVAITGLRKVADWMCREVPESINTDERAVVQRAAKFIRDSFYVDDALHSTKTAAEAIEVLKTAREALNKYNIRLHKIVSSNHDVVNHFPESERGKRLEITFDEPDLHRTLGVQWDVASDCFTMNVQLRPRPFTRRGILSIVNSVFDPIGFAAPITLKGKLLQRNIISSLDNPQSIDWDAPLSIDFVEDWQRWLQSLKELNTLSLPRCYAALASNVAHRSLHVYTDASQDAIGYAVYLRSISDDNCISVAFVSGDSRVAPKGASSIPRLELCGAVEASKAACYITSQLSFNIEDITFYSDSLVVLGYIRNERRQFTRYVTRRIEIIRNLTSPKQWQYVSSQDNPADYATKPTDCNTLNKSNWFTGPTKLKELHVTTSIPNLPSELPESVENKMHALSTKREEATTFDNTLLRLNWVSSLRVVGLVLKFTRLIIDRLRQRKGVHLAPADDMCYKKEAYYTLIRDSQRASISSTIKTLYSAEALPENNKLVTLSPFVDDNGLVRVGGRLQRSSLPFNEKHPIFIPHEHAISKVIIEHFHKKTGHQGRLITLGAIRDAGLFLQHGKQAVKRFIRQCTTCKRLRGRMESQLMAELPSTRTELTPPFTNCGCDVLGPWSITDGVTTRRQASTKKCWALLFTCFYSRAVHVEMLPGLDISSFKNAMRRFLSLRGPCKSMRSDRGTNFVGAVAQESDIKAIVEDLSDNSCSWEFNPPHSSHFGGVWERKIEQLRRSLDAAILQLRQRALTRDELHTFLFEAAAIVNSTPITEISADSNDPKPITPNMLLTLKPSHTFDTDFITPSTLDTYGKQRWKRVQYIAHQFWVRWRREYLHSLQERQKWLRKRPSLSKGDVVLLKDKNVSRNKWPFGLIESVKYSGDGLVRSVIVKVVKQRNDSDLNIAFYERPVSELVLLVKSK